MRRERELANAGCHRHSRCSSISLLKAVNHRCVSGRPAARPRAVKVALVGHGSCALRVRLDSEKLCSGQ